MEAPARVPLAQLPTPFSPAPRFGRDVAGAEVWIKRDDCTGLGMGGNKARKLEFLIAAARARGADTVIAFGGVQSNLTRMTAAACRQAGLECHLILAGSPPAEVTGNLLLCHVLGAGITYLSLTPAELDAARVERAFAEQEDRLKSAGRRPFRIGPGGSVPLGVLGYSVAFDEMMAQARSAGAVPSRIFLAYGTGGTLAGLVLGNVLAGRPARITAISVAPPGMAAALGAPPVEELVLGAAELMGERVSLQPEDIEISYEHAGRAYAALTSDGVEAIRALARTEGIFLDPVYTGKAMAGLIASCRQDRSRGADRPVAFVHTGGLPGLFPYHAALTP